MLTLQSALRDIITAVMAICDGVIHYTLLALRKDVGSTSPQYIEENAL
jgi:hypothetical protein